MNNKNNMPQHIAIIMDGNGRWARRRRLPKIMGHRAGAKAVREVVETSAKIGVKILTLYAFSSENWKRPREEVSALMNLLREFLIKEEKNLNKNKIRLNAIGRINELPDPVRATLTRVMRSTRKNTGLLLNLALNYGSRNEIVDACRAIASEVAAGRYNASRVDEKLISDHLYTRSLPDPDLLIRTSGEMRLSNFLLWQASYTELYVTKKNWPEFTGKDLEAAIREFQKRERRFGG